MRIPLVDLRAQHLQVRDEVLLGWERVLAETAFVLGADVEAFEREFAEFCGVRHCIGVANGTDAIELGLRALGVGPGQEVIVPANSFVASAAAVARTGAAVRLVDVLEGSLLVDPDAVAAAVNPRTAAIMPVHLFGQVAPMAPLRRLADAAGIPILEDAAQAQGARQEDVVAGGFGLAAATSFYPGKNLGAYGDAGAVLTSSDELAQRVRRLRNHGSETKYAHTDLGFNSRLDTLQAVVLRAKLRRLAGWNEARRCAAATYDTLLADVDGVVGPSVLPGNTPIWHLYVVQVPQRDHVLAELQRAGIEAGIHYPVPIHLHGAFQDLGLGPGSFPVAEAAARRILSLPLFPEITPELQHEVVDAVRSALR